ncbi:hypothetical protein F4818DRAFT_399231 [Hypoxylon cercidicola]|nr:hypothetical protein F4818DRAFT_399231 [Hypoxylon cercidicola]
MATSEPSSGDGLLVIHVALFRMATRSLAHAYRILGYKVHHALDVDNLLYENPWPFIEEAAEGTWPDVPNARRRPRFTREDWDRVWGTEYDIATDLAGPFADQLIAAYPNAKVVIVQRDFDSWWPSYLSECIDGAFSPIQQVVIFLLWHVLGARAGYAIRKVHFGLFGAKTRAEIESNAREGYERYYKRIREMVPPERRLEYKIGDGWEPLCKFLGKDVPDVPFPHLNDRKAHESGNRARRHEVLLSSAKAAVPWLLGLAVAATAIRYAAN